jgi:hypothetical protein
MSSAEPRTGPVTLVGVWRMDPSVQADFLQAVTQTLTEQTGKLDGFLGAAVLASLNGAEVVVQIEWETVENAQRLEGVPDVGALLRDLRAVARHDRNTYRLAARVEPGAGSGATSPDS